MGMCSLHKQIATVSPSQINYYGDTLSRSGTTFRSISIFCTIVLIVGVLFWDVVAMAFSPNDTISNVLTEWNPKTGGLLALLFLALWVHWFLPLPQCWKGCQGLRPIG